MRFMNCSQDSHNCFYVSCSCSSSLKALLLSHNSDKEDFPESTIEDIKGWSKMLVL